MSLAGSGSNGLPQSKLPTRRLSRKPRDRGTRERKKEIGNVKSVKSNVEHSPAPEKPKVINILPMPKILESVELSQKVTEEILKQARLQPPQPPPRQMTHSSMSPSSTPTLPKLKNNSPLISSLLERKIQGSLTPRSVTPTSPRPISIDPLPFPTHLAHRSIMKVSFPLSLRVAPMF
jgi:hypothetical protein